MKKEPIPKADLASTPKGLSASDIYGTGTTASQPVSLHSSACHWYPSIAILVIGTPP